MEGHGVLQRVRAVDGQHIAVAETPGGEAGRGSAHGVGPCGIA